MRAPACIALLCAALWLAAPAAAHLMPPGQGAVRLVGDSAYAVISVPVAVLDGVDDNRDGLLERAELDAHRAAVGAQLSQRLRLFDGDREGALLFEDLLLAHAGEPKAKGESDLVVVRRYAWPSAVSALRVDARLFDKSATAGATLAMKAIAGERSESALLSARRSGHAFFAGPWRAFGTWVASGAEHIVLGADHLLFLLTVLVAGAGWRYWLAVVSSFTAAHSITLVCAGLGWVEAPPRVVETLIAASIVLLALDSLWRRNRATRQRPVLVFACGLLHGLGIAAVLADGGLPASERAASLLGFNLGVEIGQLAFIGAALALMALARRLLAPKRHGAIATACSVAAACTGSWWMVERALLA